MVNVTNITEATSTVTSSKNSIYVLWIILGSISFHFQMHFCLFVPSALVGVVIVTALIVIHVRKTTKETIVAGLFIGNLVIF